MKSRSFFSLPNVLTSLGAAAALAAMLIGPAPTQATIGGACCSTAGMCSFQSEFNCGQTGGSFHGDGSVCGQPPAGFCNSCGDGFEDAQEVCDDGNTSNSDCCRNNCTDPVCGDGFVQSCFKEECDDANTANGDGCDIECQIEIVTTTTTLPPSTTTTLPIVGACCSLLGPSANDDGGSSAGRGSCFLTTQNGCEVGTYQGDGTLCSDPGICATCGNGSIESGEECDDGDTASGDGCDDTCAEEQCWDCVGSVTTTFIITGGVGGPSICLPDNAESCDDGDVCTLSDTCNAGVCGGEAVLIPAACDWVIVGGDPDKNVQSRTRSHAVVTGDICGDTDRIGDSTQTNGDIVATASSGKGIFFAAAAQVDGDIITDGASVVGKPRDTLLPGLDTDEVPGGSTESQSGDPNDIYDTTGSNTRVDECNEAQTDVDDGAALLDALASTEDRGDVQVKGNQTLTINPTVVGGLNVIDFDRLRTGNNATIQLSGGGSATTIYVLRIDKKFDLRLQSDLQFINGQLANNVVIYSRSKCKIGEDVTGGGTVLCPDGKLKMEERVIWGGALLGGKKRVQVRDSAELTHVPLLIPIP